MSSGRVLFVGLLALLGCDSGREDEPRLQRLWEKKLTFEPPLERSSEQVWEERFAGDLSDWHVITDAANPLASDPNKLRVVLGEKSEGGRCLSLGGREGGVVGIVPVEPNALYRFRGRARTQGLKPVHPYAAVGSRFFLIELRRSGAFEDVFAQGTEAVSVRRIPFPGAVGDTPWTEHERAFRTSGETVALAVACLLELGSEVRSGAAEFADLELHTIDTVEFWESLRGEWLGRPDIGGETRPAIGVLPGQAARIDAVVGSRGPRLELAVAGFGEEGRKRSWMVTVAGRELASGDDPPFDRWHLVEVSLEEWAGRKVELEFRVEGAGPVWFGAPLVSSRVRRFSPNVILLSIDTLRSDHLSFNGYEPETSPNLDRLAHESLLFEDVTAQSPYTMPSHASLFSGQVPRVHGMHLSSDRYSADRSPALAETLAARGYRTQAFTGGGLVHPQFGFDRGFDGYTRIDPIQDRASVRFERLIAAEPDDFSRQLISEHDFTRVLDWIERHRDEPFFLFLHTYTVHNYDAPGVFLERFEGSCGQRDLDIWPLFNVLRTEKQPLTSDELAHVVHRYDAAIAYVDEAFGRLRSKLGELGLADETILVVTSDHGEELGERGFVRHSTTLYEELTRIPWILHVPGRSPSRIDTPAMTIDIAPTLLGVLGIETDARMQGADVLALRAAPERVLWSEVDAYARRFAARTSAGWKLIHNPPEGGQWIENPREWELYDLVHDPHELNDRADEDPDRLERLRSRLLRRRSEFEMLALELGPGTHKLPTQEVLRELQALGYGR